LIIAGDVGGTNTRLAWFEVSGGRLVPGVTRTYPSQRHTSLDEIVATFLREAPGTLAHACIGIAGPVREGRVEATNLAWGVDARPLAAGLGLDRVILINDLEANAWGLAALPDSDFTVLQPGRPAPTGNAAVISAGTGLGEAELVWDSRHHRGRLGAGPPTSPGTTCKAPCRFLTAEVGHVSVERVLSGPGLHNIYRFLRDAQGLAEPDWLAELLRSEAPAPVIGRVGLEGRAEICVRALGLFVAIYGAEAGNLGLRVLATAGVYRGRDRAGCSGIRAGRSSTRCRQGTTPSAPRRDPGARGLNDRALVGAAADRTRRDSSVIAARTADGLNDPRPASVRPLSAPPPRVHGTDRGGRRATASPSWPLRAHAAQATPCWPIRRSRSGRVPWTPPVFWGTKRPVPPDHRQRLSDGRPCRQVPIPPAHVTGPPADQTAGRGAIRDLRRPSRPTGASGRMAPFDLAILARSRRPRIALPGTDAVQATRLVRPRGWRNGQRGSRSRPEPGCSSVPRDGSDKAETLAAVLEGVSARPIGKPSPRPARCSGSSTDAAARQALTGR
jgi:glucokinase